MPILNSKDFKVSNMFNTPPPLSVNVMLGEDHWNLREQCAGQVTFRAVRTASSLLARFRSWTQETIAQHSSETDRGVVMPTAHPH